MDEMLIVLFPVAFVLVWAACGIVAYGGYLAYFWKEFDVLQNDKRWASMCGSARWWALGGPLSLFVTLSSGDFKYGLMYRRGDSDGRHRERNQEAEGGGAYANALPAYTPPLAAGNPQGLPGLGPSLHTFQNQLILQQLQLTAATGTVWDKLQRPVVEPEDYDGIIRAYRMFNVTDAGLTGSARGEWSGPQLEAECNTVLEDIVGKHSVFDCPGDHGIYGSWDWVSARGFVEGSVLAACVFWGDVVVGTSGLRAQHCRIERAWTKSRVGALILKEWGVPYEVVDEFPDFGAFPRPAAREPIG